LLTLIHSLTIYKIPKEIKLQIEILDVLQANILHKTFQSFQNYLRFFKHDLHAQIIYSVIVSHAIEKKNMLQQYYKLDGIHFKSRKITRTTREDLYDYKLWRRNWCFCLQKKCFYVQWSHTLNQIHLFSKDQKFIQFSSCVLYSSHAWCSRCCCCCCCLAKKSEKRFRRMLTICYGNRWLVGCGFVAKETKKTGKMFVDL